MNTAAKTARSQIRALIADDESAARDKLERLLRAHDDVAIVGSASSGSDAVAQIRETNPDVLFLDIRMPRLDGFQVLEQLSDQPLPHVIFVTAFDEYAPRAFDVRALDYLLKPYDAERLDDAISRVRERIAAKQPPSNAHDLQATIEGLREAVGTVWSVETKEEQEYTQRLCIRSPGRVQIVRTADIEWIEAYGNYVRIHTTDGRPLLRESMRHIEQTLDPAKFARIHRGAIVSLHCVREMRPLSSGDYVVTLLSGTCVKLSRSYRAAFEERLGARRG